MSTALETGRRAAAPGFRKPVADCRLVHTSVLSMRWLQACHSHCIVQTVEAAAGACNMTVVVVGGIEQIVAESSVEQESENTGAPATADRVVTVLTGMAGCSHNSPDLEWGMTDTVPLKASVTTKRSRYKQTLSMKFFAVCRPGYQYRHPRPKKKWTEWGAEADTDGVGEAGMVIVVVFAVEAAARAEPEKKAAFDTGFGACHGVCKSMSAVAHTPRSDPGYIPIARLLLQTQLDTLISKSAREDSRFLDTIPLLRV